VLLALLAGTAPAGAADSAGNYAIWGAGARSCHQFRRAGDDAASLAPFRDFLMGYLTAYNTLAPQTYNALGKQSLEDALGWIGEYCATHQIDSFERAVTQLVVAHHEQRTRGVGHGGGSGGSWGRPAPAGEAP